MYILNFIHLFVEEQNILTQIHIVISLYLTNDFF